MSNLAVSLEKVSVRINSSLILRENTFSVKEHSLCAIVGPNGGGKTTLLKVLLGMISPFSGQIQVLGRQPNQVRHLIGYVPQHSVSDASFPINVWDVVLMGLLAEKGLFGRIKSHDKDKAYQALKTVKMHKFKNKPIGVLSGGERQRVLLARALVNKPRLLLLDEPTASIDPKMKTSIYELLYSLKQQTTIILVTHDMSIIGGDIDLLACLNKNLHIHNDQNNVNHALETVYNCPVEIVMNGIKKNI